uniref:Uncharacterized protein n=1 Tax=Amphora coffeiformis TaxID=265554 RepID=A0A7S3P832_9STRA|mmetsp:Transcript_15658/g.29898  ORF Transcript_15658/g.29898 Transcript_15658/m.29898 type:complete len:306 (+) Transcript_15658:131-1048(+)|eukprot:scaffold34646_cov173-Amphora_coffeaeformis.AAC.26
MMKSIFFNDSTNPANEEGFVIVDTPMEFDSSSVLEEDEESYDHCDDAFSFSSLHQSLPVSSLPMGAVRDNFFEPPAVGQEVVPPAVPSSNSLSDGEDEESPTYASEKSSTLKVVIPHIDSDVEGLCALVSSIPSVPPSGEIVCPSDETNAEVLDESIPYAVGSVEDHAEENDTPSCPSADLMMAASGEDKQEEAGPTTSSSRPATSADEVEDDEVGSSGPDNALESLEEPPVGRMSKKKRRKQMKLAKKAAAAAAAAALHQMSLPPKRRGKNRKKVANIAVSCAVQSIAEYKEHVDRNKFYKKIH